MNGKWTAACGLGFVICLALAVSQSRAAEIARFTFDNSNNPTENTGIGPDGMLFGGASVADGRLMIDGLDQGMDLPLGSFNPFSGETDWSVSFDFATAGNPTSGAMFSSDGSGAEPFPAGQEGSLNIYLREGNVVMDFWFVGEIESESNTYNDDAMHRLEASYAAATGTATLTLDGTDVVMEEEWSYSRDVSGDRTRIGDETNPDFGEEFNPEGFSGYFDNVVIQGVPEPSSLLLGVFGAAAVWHLRWRRAT